MQNLDFEKDFYMSEKFLYNDFYNKFIEHYKRYVKKYNTVEYMTKTLKPPKTSAETGKKINNLAVLYLKVVAQLLLNKEEMYYNLIFQNIKGLEKLQALKKEEIKVLRDYIQETFFYNVDWNPISSIPKNSNNEYLFIKEREYYKYVSNKSYYYINSHGSFVTFKGKNNKNIPSVEYVPENTWILFLPPLNYKSMIKIRSAIDTLQILMKKGERELLSKYGANYRNNIVNENCFQNSMLFYPRQAYFDLNLSMICREDRYRLFVQKSNVDYYKGHRNFDQIKGVRDYCEQSFSSDLLDGIYDLTNTDYEGDITPENTEEKIIDQLQNVFVENINTSGSKIFLELTRNTLETKLSNLIKELNEKSVNKDGNCYIVSCCRGCGVNQADEIEIQKMFIYEHFVKMLNCNISPKPLNEEYIVKNNCNYIIGGQEWSDIKKPKNTSVIPERYIQLTSPFFDHMLSTTNLLTKIMKYITEKKPQLKKPNHKYVIYLKRLLIKYMCELYKYADREKKYEEFKNIDLPVKYNPIPIKYIFHKVVAGNYVSLYSNKSGIFLDDLWTDIKNDTGRCDSKIFVETNMMEQQQQEQQEHGKQITNRSPYGVLPINNNGNNNRRFTKKNNTNTNKTKKTKTKKTNNKKTNTKKNNTNTNKTKKTKTKTKKQ